MGDAKGETWEIPTIERCCGEAGAPQFLSSIARRRSNQNSEVFTVPRPSWQMVALTVQDAGVKMEAPHSGPNQARACGMGRGTQNGQARLELCPASARQRVTLSP